MWKTGKESLPSFTPRVESMTEMKWMQVLSSKGAEDDLVRSWQTSAFQTGEFAGMQVYRLWRRHWICCQRH